MVVLRATASLVAQLRIVYADLALTQPASETWTPDTAAALQGFGRRYAAEMFMAAQVRESVCLALANAEVLASLTDPCLPVRSGSVTKPPVAPQRPKESRRPRCTPSCSAHCGPCACGSSA